MVKQRLTTAVLTAAAGLFLGVCTASAAPLIESGELQVGIDLTYPPYEYMDTANNPAGLDVEFATLIAKAANLSAKFLDTRFENLIIGVSGDKFDIIVSSLYVTPERAKKIDYIPYVKSGVSIAVSATATKRPETPEDLCGLKVSSIKAAAWIAALQKLSKTTCVTNGRGPIDVREFPTSPEATQALLSGGVDAQMEDSAALQGAAKATDGKIVISSKTQLYPVILGLGFKKGNADLEKIVSDAFTKVKADGSYDALLAKYNVSSASEEEFQKAIGSAN